MIHAPLGVGCMPRRRRGWRAALFAPLLLASCGPTADTEIRFAPLTPPHPPAEAGAPARFTDSEFIADDGARLPLRKWLPRDGVKAVILALHGFGDYSHAFEMPARVWAERGIATYAFDQRGFGGAPGHGLWAGTGQRAGGMEPLDDGPRAEARAVRRGPPLSGHGPDRPRAARHGVRQSADAEGAGEGSAGVQGSANRHDPWAGRSDGRRVRRGAAPRGADAAVVRRA